MSALPSADPSAPAAAPRPVTRRGRRPGDRRIRIERPRQRTFSRRVSALVHRVLGA